MQAQNERLMKLLAGPVETLGYLLWGIELTSDAQGTLLRVYIDKEGGVDVDDCGRVSHQVGGILDVEDAVRGEYTLEVSSPGLYRPLFTEAQYRRYLGDRVRIKMHAPVQGRRKFRGRLLDCSDRVAVVEDQDGAQWELPLASVAAANLDPEINFGRR